MASTMPPMETPMEQRRRADATIRQQLAEEFAPHQHFVGEHLDSEGAVERIYGGQSASRPKELSLVRVQRRIASGGFVEELGVVHRVHAEDDTLTVQFPSDQHRLRVPSAKVQLVQTVTPTYPKVRLQPGERLPTRAQVDRREAELEAERRNLGLPQGAMLPWQEAEQLHQGEHKDADGAVRKDADHWGIPVPTLDALKHRSIPPGEVTGVYGRHFYSGLYERQKMEAMHASYALAGFRGPGGPGPGAFGPFAPGPGRLGPGSGPGFGSGGPGPGLPGYSGKLGTGRSAMDPSQSGVTGSGAIGGALSSAKPGERLPDGRKVVSHVYIPLEGPEMQMNPATGGWEIAS